MGDLVRESKVLQFEVGSEQQTVQVLEHPCLWHRNRYPVFFPKTESIYFEHIIVNELSLDMNGEDG